MHKPKVEVASLQSPVLWLFTVVIFNCNYIVLGPQELDKSKLMFTTSPEDFKPEDSFSVAMKLLELTVGSICQGTGQNHLWGNKKEADACQSLLVHVQAVPYKCIPLKGNPACPDPDALQQQGFLKATTLTIKVVIRLIASNSIPSIYGWI